MKQACREVAGNYPFYELLLNSEKLTRGYGIVVVDAKPSNIKWLAHHLPVEHLTIVTNGTELHTEVGLKQDGNFKFLLFARQFMLTPLANYDSKGVSHRNDREDVPLTEQLITTPHFNRYNEDGNRYAYKTAALRDPQLAVQLEDIANCIFHFYDEFNIHHEPAGYPTVEIRSSPQTGLFAEPISDDPLAYVPRF